MGLRYKTSISSDGEKVRIELIGFAKEKGKMELRNITNKSIKEQLKDKQEKLNQESLQLVFGEDSWELGKSVMGLV